MATRENHCLYRLNITGKWSRDKNETEGHHAVSQRNNGGLQKTDGEGYGQTEEKTNS